MGKAKRRREIGRPRRQHRRRVSGENENRKRAASAKNGRREIGVAPAKRSACLFNNARTCNHQRHGEKYGGSHSETRNQQQRERSGEGVWHHAAHRGARKNGAPRGSAGMRNGAAEAYRRCSENGAGVKRAATAAARVTAKMKITACAEKSAKMANNGIKRHQHQRVMANGGVPHQNQPKYRACFGAALACRMRHAPALPAARHHAAAWKTAKWRK